MASLHPAAKRSERNYLVDPDVRWLIDADIAIQQAISGQHLETELQVIQILRHHTILELEEVQSLMKEVKNGIVMAQHRAIELLSEALRRRHDSCTI